MKQLFSFCLMVCLSTAANSQTSIKLEDVSKHINDSVNVCGQIASGRYMDQTNRKLTLLNMGAAFPNQLLVIVIENDLRGKFDVAPETFFLNKEVCVTGKITVYRDSPQIVIYKKEQLQIGRSQQ